MTCQEHHKISSAPPCRERVRCVTVKGMETSPLVCYDCGHPLEKCACNGAKKSSLLSPAEIYNEIKKDVIGQDETIRYVAVAAFKHTMGERLGNLLLIGNSGTGKTTIMRSLEKLYNTHPSYEKFRVILRVHANVLADEDGRACPAEVLFRLMEEKARLLLKDKFNAETLKDCMEHATVCIDEIDKISSIVGGKPYVTGINIQQALLTLMEGEEILHETTVEENGAKKKAAFHVDTGNILFLCGGAFEYLYDIVHTRVVVKEKQDLFKQVVQDDGAIIQQEVFHLKDFLRLEDLFEYGMLPQFLSRFDNRVVMRDLSAADLRHIFIETRESVFTVSKNFFRKMGINIKMTNEAVRMLTTEAARHTRIGARALKDIYTKLINDYEYEPFSQDDVKKLDGGSYELTLTENMVQDVVNKFYVTGGAVFAPVHDFGIGKIRIGTAPVNWGLEPMHAWIEKPPYDKVLDEMSQAGYEATELGYTYPRDAEKLKSDLKKRRLELSAAYCALTLTNSDALKKDIESALTTAKLLKAAGASFIIIADKGDDRRRSLAGRVADGTKICVPDESWKDIGKALNDFGKQCGGMGLTCVFHNHAGTYVETQREISRLVDATDSDSIGLCPDTGHLVYGGCDPVEMFKQYGALIRYIHFKDIHPEILKRAREKQMDYLTAVKAGIFVELGEGCVDFGKIFQFLRRMNYSGWIVVEQDTSRKTPFDSAMQSRRYLKQNFHL